MNAGVLHENPSRKDSMDINQFRTWLASIDEQLVEAVVADVAAHVAGLDDAHRAFYGYAVLPSDDLTAAGPPNISVAYNLESDIDPKNKKSNYYRFSVDEWANYGHDGFDRTNVRLNQLAEQFEELRGTFFTSPRLQPEDSAYIAKRHQSIVRALQVLKERRVFRDETFLVIWLSDSDDNIMLNSAKVLNPQKVYKAFASAFS
jgi:hypothetical protein